MYRIKWWRIIALLFLAGAIVLHPVSRRILWLILPLGTRPDDLVVFGFIVVFVGVLLAFLRVVANRRRALAVISSLFLENPKEKNH